MPPQALPVIVGDELRAERFRHGAFGLAVIAQQFFQAILRLRVAGSESRARRGSGIDVRHAKLVAQNLDLLRRAESERHQSKTADFMEAQYNSGIRGCGRRFRLPNFTSSVPDRSGS